MKRILLSVIALIVLFSVMGCGGGDSGGGGTKLTDAEINSKVAALFGAQNTSNKVDQHEVMTNKSVDSFMRMSSTLSNSSFEDILGTLHWVGPNDGWYTATLSYNESNYTYNCPFQFKQLSANQYEIKMVNATMQYSYVGSTYQESDTCTFELLDFTGTQDAQNRWTGKFTANLSEQWVNTSKNLNYTYKGTSSASFSNSSLADGTGSFIRDASYHSSVDNKDHANHWEYTLTLTGSTYALTVFNITKDGQKQPDWNDTWTK